jgi:hypothetical protein
LELRAQAPNRLKIVAGPPQMIMVKKSATAPVSLGAWLLSVCRRIVPASP